MSEGSLTGGPWTTSGRDAVDWWANPERQLHLRIEALRAAARVVHIVSWGDDLAPPQIEERVLDFADSFVRWLEAGER